MKRIFYKAGDKFRRLLTGKAFYGILSACVVLIGAAGYIATKQTINRMGDVLSDASLWETPSDTYGLYSPDDFMRYPEYNTGPAQNSDDGPVSDAIGQFNQDNETDRIDDVPVPVVQEQPEKENDRPVSYAPPIYVRPLEGEALMPYSVETLLYSNTMRDWRAHTGIDIAGEPGTHVVAITDGVVEDVYEDELYGWSVALSHNGGLISIYRCLSEAVPVNIGDKVKRGEVIGGVSGDDSLMEAGEVPHLHFELIRDGGHIDPAEIFP